MTRASVWTLRILAWALVGCGDAVGGLQLGRTSCGGQEGEDFGTDCDPGDVYTDVTDPGHTDATDAPTDGVDSGGAPDQSDGETDGETTTDDDADNGDSGGDTDASVDTGEFTSTDTTDPSETSDSGGLFTDAPFTDAEIVAIYHFLRQYHGFAP